MAAAPFATFRLMKKLKNECCRKYQKSRNPPKIKYIQEFKPSCQSCTWCALLFPFRRRREYSPCRRHSPPRSTPTAATITLNNSGNVFFRVLLALFLIEFKQRVKSPRLRTGGALDRGDGSAGLTCGAATRARHVTMPVGLNQCQEDQNLVSDEV